MTDQTLTAWTASILICGIAVALLFYFIRKFIIVCAVLTRPMQVRKGRYNRVISASLRSQAAEIQHSHQRPVSLDKPHFTDDNEDSF